jgi:hypothetical protein
MLLVETRVLKKSIGQTPAEFVRGARRRPWLRTSPS